MSSRSLSPIVPVGTTQNAAALALADAVILGHEQARVPRYTSYPTAPHFGDGVDETAYRGWLADLSPGASLSIYLHVPFCRSMCWFCGCHTRATRHDTPVIAYAADLRAEMDLLLPLLSAPGPVRHVHWGGGTPNILEPQTFVDIMAHLRDRLRFAPDAEIAVELDPRTVTPQMIEAMAQAGVTRVSLGIQSFEPQVQQAINRVQSYGLAARLAQDLRKAGILCLNLDLMYGLPGQDVANVAQSTRQALDLAPDRLSVFGYAHLPRLKRHQRMIDESALPGAAARLAQCRAISDVLTQADYTPIGLDHFARGHDPLSRALQEGRLRRNFQGYTTDPADILLPLGASAIGAFPQGYAQNIADVALWHDAVRAGRLPIKRGKALSSEDRLRRAVIEHLMCFLWVDLAAIAAAHDTGPSVFTDSLERLRPLQDQGAVIRQAWRLTVPEAFRPLIRSIACAFDTYLHPEEDRHARAV
ncbi:MAG: oxygen-independent coproporphyrinogen III oxidase [Alphaproteobacteria bacterium]|nr:MAG: oxygen-independent coproporphyrinogen III oxidase [Alphaproteobacteria bacterium]